MKVMMEQDGTMEIRPESSAENYMLKKWYEDWQAHTVTLRISYKDGVGGYTKDVVTLDGS